MNTGGGVSPDTALCPEGRGGETWKYQKSTLRTPGFLSELEGEYQPAQAPTYKPRVAKHDFWMDSRPGDQVLLTQDTPVNLALPSVISGWTHTQGTTFYSPGHGCKSRIAECDFCMGTHPGGHALLTQDMPVNPALPSVTSGWTHVQGATLCSLRIPCSSRNAPLPLFSACGHTNHSRM